MINPFTGAASLGTMIANITRTSTEAIRDAVYDLQWDHLTGEYQPDPTIMLGSRDQGNTFVEYPDTEHNRQMWSQKRYRQLEGQRPASRYALDVAGCAIEDYRDYQHRLHEASLGHQSQLLSDW